MASEGGGGGGRRGLPESLVRSGTLGDIDGDDDELAVVDIDEPRDDVCEVVRVTDFVFVDVWVDVRVSEGVRV